MSNTVPMKSMNSLRLAFLFLLVTGAALTRLLPHPNNFTAIGAIALLGGACVASGPVGFAMTLAALAISDLFLGMYDLLPVVYASFGVSFLLGRWLRTKRTLPRIVLATLAGAIQFFLITNFACWLYYYPHTWEGLVSCFTLAIPFFQNTLLGDAVFVAALFSGVALVEYLAPSLRETPVSAAELS